MKWLILAIFAEVSVLLCLIYSFDGALHSWSSARLTWDHAAVAVVYTYVRVRILAQTNGQAHGGALAHS